jgi:GxxExxY protein
MELLNKDKTYKIIGTAMEVHAVLGPGFLEPIYQEAFEIELQKREIPHMAQKPIRIYYKDIELTKLYIADFLCYQDILVEIKALSELNSGHEAQLLNYLKATKIKVGLLINFGTPQLQFKRLVL